MSSATDIWTKVLDKLGEILTPVVVSAALEDAEPVKRTDTHLVIYSPYHKEMILNNYKTYIEETLRTHFSLPLQLVVWDKEEFQSHLAQSRSLWQQHDRFTFETFVAGETNEIPFKIALHVAENPEDMVFNPLFLFGPPGVGKTHLLYAIANRASQINPNAKVVYIKSDQFTSELIQAIRTGTTAELKKKYREADLFLMDDIQFIAGKEATQEEFFHTFNALYENNKQIVISSDRKPSDMATLEDRLRGRFCTGVMVKVDPPDLQTRKQIIRVKAKALNLDLGEDGVDYLAKKLCDHVRQIEGGLRKLKAYQSLTNMSLTLPNIAKTVADIQTSESCAVVTADTVVRYVCRYYGVEENLLRGPRRQKAITEPRQVAMYLIRHLTNLSFLDIGQYFNRDRTTVLHAVEKVESLCQSKGSGMAEILREIKENIQNNA